MKGVIVQVGEPKSIVLYNNGKVGAIQTPAECHVGMVVTVKLNNKLKIIAIIFAAVLLLALGIFIGAIFRRGGTAAPAFPVPMMPGYENGGGHGRMMMGSDGHGWMMMERGRQFQTVTVETAKNLPEDTRVILTGNIVQSLGDEKYIFRDSTGEITVEIDRKIWPDTPVNESERVEISGEVDIERRQVVIDVKSVRKL